jgi:hypothetical protein
MTTTEYETDTGTDNRRGVRARAGDKIGAVRTRAADAYSSARERTGAAYDSARERASSAASSAREGASRARQRTSDGIDANPLGAVVGGLALGALIAAILPKSRREEELLGDYGRRINDTAREAARAAKEAGRGKLDELGLNQDRAKQTLTDLAGKAKEAARTSAGAAARSVKSSQPR